MVDTNVLVYAASHAEIDADKTRAAADLLDRLRIGISAQVLQEFIVTTTRKVHRSWSTADAQAWLDALRPMPCIPIDAALVRRGAAIATEYRISYWDGAILAAAHALDAPVLYTEDLNHGQRYGAVQVVNPFRPN
ncbi:PIN domain-containing protein [Salinarimonas rosea]|uniref:PIN domain-containing protein n=1 Tax=Salinarimonas rosea TaxID=552063 RepID=UPI0003F7E3E8|nr:PIN domain-containing protein [Salinarimonas rosea]